MLRTCQLTDGVEGRAALKHDRKQVVESLSKFITSRSQAVLSDPILNDMAVFDHRPWPQKDVLKHSYIDEVTRLYHMHSLSKSKGGSESACALWRL